MRERTSVRALPVVLPLLIGLAACRTDEGRRGAPEDAIDEAEAATAAERHAEPAPTFAADVAPILAEHCQSCHRPGGGAPLSLATYEQARAQAEAIAAAVTSGRMPPWLPEPGYVELAGARRLSKREIATLRRWAEAGAPRGDLAAAPEPAVPAVEGWTLGEPDRVVTTARDYTPSPGGGDVFRNFVIPDAVWQTRWVRAAEFRVEDRRVVHHAQLMLDPTGDARRLAADDPGPGYSGMVHAAGARNPDGFFVGWTPGKIVAETDAGFAWRLEPGTDLVLMLHLRPGPDPQPLRPRIGLHFADEAPARNPVLIRLSAPTLDIPPGAREYRARDAFRLPVDVELRRVYPHAHYLARRMWVDAVLPDGTTRWLLRIDDWDFDWQEEYRYAEAIGLRAGSTIRMRYSYDNSATNPRNPHRPPRRVVYGPESTDEMAELLVQAVPREPGDLPALSRAVERHGQALELAFLRHQAKIRPDDPGAHYDLGLALQARGRLHEAAEAYRRAADLGAGFVEAHVNLGVTLQKLGRIEEAIVHYRRATELEPAHAPALTNLASAFHRLEELDSALHYFQRALMSDPNDARARAGLGFALAASGRYGEAVEHFRRATELAPDWVTPWFAAAWTLATRPEVQGKSAEDARQAIRMGERAAELSERSDPMVLDALAAAYAAAGRFDDAVAVGEEAHALARVTGNPRLAVAIGERLSLYRRGLPYREVDRQRF